MSDIVAELRERALQAEQDGEPISLLDEAAGEIEKLRSWVRIQDAVIRSGNVAALTDAEREVVERACRWIATTMPYESQSGAEDYQTLRGLLKRMSPTTT